MPYSTRDFLDSLVEASPDAMSAISREGEVLFWNRGAEAIFGYSREDAVGRSLFELIVRPEQEAEARRGVEVSGPLPPRGCEGVPTRGPGEEGVNVVVEAGGSGPSVEFTVRPPLIELMTF